jgi:flavorubredoxin
VAISANEATELIPGRLYGLGGLIPIDGNVTWVPERLRGHQPALCYLTIEENHAVLFDTGLRWLEKEIVAQLHAVLAPGKPLSIFLSRSEFDCTGNFAAITHEFPVHSLYTGGGQNPFDAFSDMTALPDNWKHRVELARTPVGEALPLDESGRWLVLAPAVRTLATYWAYDAGTRTLFTSDMFGHTLGEPGVRPVIDDSEHDTTTYEEVRDHMLAKFFWLTSAHTRKLIVDVEAMFTERPVEIVAPGHGRVLMGPAVVNRHRDLVIRVLEEVGLK